LNHSLEAESTTESVWKHTAGVTHFPPLQEDITVEIAIVGAGITGMTAAILLQQAGYHVAVLDSHPVGYGVSGFNSGHLTSMLLDMKFKNIIAAFGEESTRAVALELEEAITLIERNVRDYRIECDFRRVAGYLYAEKHSQLTALQQEFEAASKAGLSINRTFNIPLPFPVEEGIDVSAQAAFNPLKYVQALAKQFSQQGGLIYENSHVEAVEEKTLGDDYAPGHRTEGQTQEGNKTGWHLKTPAGSVTARDVILATHTPIGFRPAIQARLEAMRSYIIGIRTDDVVPDALFWDMDEPYHYIRLAYDEHGPLLVIGGEDHRTGERRDTESCFRNLEDYARLRFKVKSVDYHWSAQFYDPADGLPYIGKLSDVYVATGYSGEGLTFGTLAARLISDEIQGFHNNCADILNPNRAKPLASVGGFLSENLGAMAHFVADRFKKPTVDDPSQIPLGDGAICNIHGKKVAVYHTSDGEFKYLSPVCTHMHCLVGWNPTEKSWDCPCHGGRFDAEGHVLNGPPVVDLQPMNPDG
jgi:glycine/D-amino acid oxidase-like deaminating enzyme/nitrite reductase/ring-hydroxylating ferredoxin subunit